MASALATSYEDDIPLAGVGVLVLEEEELVYAVFLESSDLDDGTDRARQAALKNEVLLPADLETPRLAHEEQAAGAKCLTYSLEQVEEVLARFVLYLVRIEASSRSHFQFSIQLTPSVVSWSAD